MAQRREIAGARVVVLEEVPVDLEVVEQHLRDGLVAAFGDPGALEIAAAEVDADRHPRGAIGDRRVDEARVAARQFVGIVAARPRALAHLRVAKIGEVRVVELQVAAARGGKRVDLGAVRGGDIGVERLEIGIGVAADRLAATAEVQHRRRRNRHLRRALRHRLEELEIGELDRLHVADRARHLHHRRRELDIALGGVEADRDAALRFDALELLEEIDVKVGAAEFAVGDSGESGVFLEPDDVADRGILHRRAARRA